MRLSSAGIFALSCVVAVLVVAAIWIAVAAAYENMRLARATDQILSFIATAQDTAAKDAKFAQDTSENLTLELWRRGLIAADATQPPVLKNIWGGDIRMTVVQPLIMRLETDVPSQACRQLGLFFGGLAADLGLQAMQARVSANSWREFYSASSGAKSPSDKEIDAGCGTAAGPTTLALVLRLR
jgi:hypothetical protein